MSSGGFFFRAFFSFCAFHPLCTFISTVLMSLCALQHAPQNVMPRARSFLYSLVICTSSLLVSFFLFIVLYFAFCLYLQHATQIFLSLVGYFCILLYSVLHPYLFLWLECLAFCLYLQHATKTSMLPVEFFFVLCLYFIHTSLSWLSWLCLFSLLYNTNIHASGGIRTRNRSKRSATDPRLRPLGHWDRPNCATVYPRIRTRNPSKRATLWLRLKRRGNWKRQKIFFIYPFRLSTSPVLVYLGLYSFISLSFT